MNDRFQLSAVSEIGFRTSDPWFQFPALWSRSEVRGPPSPVTLPARFVTDVGTDKNPEYPNKYR